MKTTKLVVEYDYDFEIVSIISSLKPYYLALQINKQLGTKLHYEDDITLNFVRNGKLTLLNFIHKTEYQCYRLIKNKAVEYENIDKPYLIPELKEYDFILHIHTEGSKPDCESIVQALKQIQGIELVRYIQNKEQLKSKDNLIF
ncbi:MAG: IPExxxVDY family protein [Cytophagaceae bacterium]|nr:IPExxxVDY family protein [Cytophagaceae bacterium]MDW8456758.1 IPExxxVDY family protein [Cytophagaceae bacterium]